jgi:hypothetical protein
MVAASGIAATAGPEREPKLRAAMVEALSPYRGPDGSYRLVNEWHYLLATASTVVTVGVDTNAP